ncbi:hypothetical protein [Ktedonospora formicarum]|uniref:Uncharacterized protein n=1 Tax=Ktedonospora formicarum TaxID=2778364 RepID=A0A8J3IDB8_9CHLR|nr:hypothetical protein [Ktedonospora formicarum]GHO49254.1 hypothetical protein KSX_74170 [Ktedonospora formicarum]
MLQGERNLPILAHHTPLRLISQALLLFIGRKSSTQELIVLHLTLGLASDLFPQIITPGSRLDRRFEGRVPRLVLFGRLLSPFLEHG